MKRKSNKNGFTGCAKAYIRNLQEEGRYSTAHVYKNAILSFPCRVESIYLPYIVLAVFYRPPLYAAINQVIITLLNAGLYAVPENICYFCP